MGPDLTGPELVAAMSNAGGLGILQAQLAPPRLFRREIQRVRELTDKPFGVNLILHFPVDEQGRDLCGGACADRFVFLGGSDAVCRSRSRWRRQSFSSGRFGRRRATRGKGECRCNNRARCGGGHIAGEVSTLALVPRVVDAVAPHIVAAAGGIADGRGVVAALALGAQAAVLGTRFLASTESRAHPDYKKKLLAVNENDTVRTTLFGFGWPNASHRTLRTPFVEQWLGREARGQESRADEPVIGHTVIAWQHMPLRRFMGFPPNIDATGDIESMDLLAGQGVGLVREIKPVAEIVRELVDEVRVIILRLSK